MSARVTRAAGAAKRKAPCDSDLKVEKTESKNAESAVTDGEKVGAARQKKRASASKSAADYHSAFYLMKNEPENFSIDDLDKAEGQTCHWEGVRNYRARNIMQAMKKGQRAFFYHSNCKRPGVVGIVEIVREAYPDHFAWDKSSDYYDEKSTPESPRWFMVDVRLVRKLDKIIALEDIKQFKDGVLRDMQLLTSSRLSVQNVTVDEWDAVLSLDS